ELFPQGHHGDHDERQRGKEGIALVQKEPYHGEADQRDQQAHPPPRAQQDGEQGVLGQYQLHSATACVLSASARDSKEKGGRLLPPSAVCRSHRAYTALRWEY